MKWPRLTGAGRSAQGRAPEHDRRRLLVTGSEGHVAGLILPLLKERGYLLTLADRRGPDGTEADLTEQAACDRVVRGVDGIIHLAGTAKEAPVERLFADNALALTNLLRSAARARVSHFVFASTMHVMGMYGRDEKFDELSPTRPDSFYAASKVHGEAICRLFHEKAGMAITCLRLGSVTAMPDDADPGAWISPEDTTAMVEIGLGLDAPAFEIFHAIAEYGGSPLPISRAARYGYRCSRPAARYRLALEKAQAWWHDDEPARTRRGGSFASGPVDEQP